MKTVLIIGGYGGFGARLSKRLAKAGWRVLVGGRRLEAATAFCAEVAGCEPVAMDRRQAVGPVLGAHKPDLMIDAAGPFQGNDYAIPCACIAAGVHYFDLADARDFVCGIGALDDAARAAGVSVISGASSVPALSGAIIKELCADFTGITSIDMAISASNRATAGPAVSASIMSYVGKPLLLWRSGMWTAATGWHMLRSDVFEVAGRQPLRRLTALSDIPDHTIVPGNIAGRPATTFRAGPEFAFQVLGIWLLSWLVKWGWLGSLSPLAKWLRFLQVPTNGLGSDRSGMFVEVKGFVGTQAIIKRWTLLAEDGDGPEIPTFAAVILADMIATKALAPGAGNASTHLTLQQFQPQFDELAIYHAQTKLDYVPLYKAILGKRFDILPKSIATLHTLVGNRGAQGEATVTRGPTWIARLLCTVMGFPPSGTTALHVGFDEHKGVEKWTRSFAGVAFSSHLFQKTDYLVERFGPLAFTFDLGGDEAGVTMMLRGWSAFGVPMPHWLGPSAQAREWDEAGTYWFQVAIHLPIVGLIVGYKGHLSPIVSAT
jgi:hypothetical protein